MEWTRDWDRPIYTTTYIKEKVVKSSHSVMSDSATPWTVAYQAPLSMGFSSKSTGVGCHFLLQGIFPTRDQTRVSSISDRRFTV